MRIQVTKLNGEYIARNAAGVEGRGSTEQEAVNAALTNARAKATAAEVVPAVAHEAAAHSDGESMGDGPSAPLGSHVGD